MKTAYLFPYRFKKAGWVLLFLGLILGVYFIIMEHDAPSLFTWPVFALASQGLLSDSTYFGIVQNNVLDEIVTLLIIIGGVLVAFTKEKFEDEFIARVRMESLLWATYVNLIVLALATLLLYDMSFYWVMLCNMFTSLFFFIIRFRWLLHRTNKAVSHEE